MAEKVALGPNGPMVKKKKKTEIIYQWQIKFPFYLTSLHI